MSTFQAFKLTQEDDEFVAKVDNLTYDELPKSDVLIKVHYSSVNYKDGLASVPNSTIVKTYPFIPGIDIAGEVVDSKDTRYKAGDRVIATSYDIGVSHFGGYSEYASVPADWIVPLPENLSLKEAMVYGTAGFTAALSIHRLEENGVTPDKGKVLVTGATGGVGSLAIAMLHKLGYQVVASTGKETAHSFLNEIGANEIIAREDVYEDKVRALDKQTWMGAIDPVGGQTLASILSKINYGGCVAVSGLTGGAKVPATVFPFILRGVTLAGIDSVYCPMELRKQIWERMATDMKPEGLIEKISKEISLQELPDALQSILKGKALGRTVVCISGNE
ncbi:acryloyl-CoA reductase [Aquibacillus koreensis]|uniref:Acryloyl-CoA reductase n=1 Tax=Aquibacillus koreensis TaxID=279446 RepID=A0A9X3WL97_9BACI|nr:acryloyl-CoA reductase [Aquibacillus koreensis]MCT2538143.1 acryloyl-CoA reductase [Aquibacillus koreensis]MDC3420913.1 acryloyl-CoA reductase [Aquibacillus koreensis]